MSDDPIDDYVWDRSGAPDEQLRRLEVLLVRYRYERPLRLGADRVALEPDEGLQS